MTFAEIPPDPADYPGALPEMLYAGSLVFVQPPGPVDRRDFRNWWQFMRGADWRHPYGAGSFDRRARAIIRSCTSRSPMRRPSRGGRARRCRPKPNGSLRRAADSTAPQYAWGDEFLPGDRAHGQHVAGRVSVAEPRDDGYERTSPVGAFPPNGYGLYDMIGNVWEWTTDWYSPRHPARRRARPAAFRAIRAARAKTRATIPASRRSGFRARCSRAARISARRTTAGAIGRPRASRSRSTRPPATSGSVASFARADAGA